MRRREFIGLAASAAAAWPLAGRAQQTSGMLRLGAADFSPRSLPSFAAFERRMAELGYREGKNITFDYVQTAGPEKSAYETGYREVVERKADILLAPGPEICLKSALAASQTTPIVMLAITYDPFERGYVATLAKPGGRITGLFLRQIELTVKRLQFLKDALPEFYSAIVFFDSISVDQWKAAEDVGAKFGVRLSGIDLHNPPFDYDRALAEAPPDNRKKPLRAGVAPLFRRSRAPDEIRLAQSSRLNVSVPRIGRRGRPHVLWAEPQWDVSSSCGRRGPNRARREARRHADRTTEQIRVRRQSDDRALSRPRPFAHPLGAR
jgi:putative ABC transport system substrate-binding protein